LETNNYGLAIFIYTWLHVVCTQSFSSSLPAELSRCL